MRRNWSRWSAVTIVALVAAVALAVFAPGAFGADDAGSSNPKSGSVGSSGVQAAGDAGTAEQLTGGPIVIMGIDAEDGGVGGHGPIANYIDVMNSVAANTTNGGSGLLVFCGCTTGDDVTAFWDAVGAGAGLAVTYVSSPAAMATQSFAGFKVIGIASGDGETGGGGLTAAGSEALAARQADFSAFVNGGGGLLVFAQDFEDTTTSNYAFLGGIGAFSFLTEVDYDNIAPTADGTAIGITDDLDVGYWHDVYTAYPSFLAPLAIADDDTSTESLGKVAALGGKNVFIGERPQPVEVEPTFTG